MSRVLVVATSRKTRGGITSVITAYEKTPMWGRYHCHWCQTHRDGAPWKKILYFVSGMLDFLIRLPFYDVVHIHTADYGTQNRKRVFARLAKLAGKKIIVHLHSSGPEYSIGGEYKDLYVHTFEIADRILVLSSQWRDELLKNYKIESEKVQILYNPCPQIQVYEVQRDCKYILFAGTLTHRKGYDDLIKAFSKIAALVPEWQLWLAGNGEIENARMLAEELSVADRVKLLGWVSGEDKDKVFRYASIYCLPSYSEGFPMGVLDAWAYNLPTVTTPVGGLPDIVVDGENSLLFNPGNIDALAIQLMRLISDKMLYEKICEASKGLSENKFNVLQITAE